MAIHRGHRLVMLCALVVLCGGLCPAATVEQVAAEVSLDSYTYILRNDLYAYAGANRHYGLEHYLARQAILERFRSFGLVAGLEPFLYNSSLDNNVVGVLPGVICPGEIYIVGAHYDAVAGSPGAYDNAAGAAGVVEAARALSQYAFEATIVFVAFDREEQGMIGSTTYVAQHAGDDIRAMINLDCIPYRPPEYQDPNLAAARVRYTMRTDLVDSLAAAMQSYAGLWCITEFGGYSDHVSFSNGGFAAAWLTSYATDNPYIHTPQDSLDAPDNINYEYATRITRGVVGYLAGQARLSPIWRSPDFNGDGIVNVADLAIFIEHWNQEDEDLSFDIAPPPAGDGEVDTLDLEGLLYYWNRQIPGSSSASR